MQTQTKSALVVPNYQNMITPPIRDTYDGTTNFVRALFGEVYKDKKISKGQIIKTNDLIFKHIGNIPFVKHLAVNGINLDSLEIIFKRQLMRWDYGIENDISSLLQRKIKFVIMVDLQENNSTLLRIRRLYESDKIIILLINRDRLADLYELFKRVDFVGFDSYLQELINRVVKNTDYF